MRDQELVNALRRLKVETGSLACLGCGHEHDCGAQGCALINMAADALGNSERHTAALQRMIENLRGQLEIRRCATCDYWQESDPRCMHPKSQYGGRTVALDNYCGYWHRHTDWILVTERLPEKEDWYHVAIRDEKTKKIAVEQDLYAVETARNFGHKIGFCKDGRWDGREKVIAWMPLPEPPEEGKL